MIKEVILLKTSGCFSYLGASERHFFSFKTGDTRTETDPIRAAALQRTKQDLQLQAVHTPFISRANARS